MTRMSLYDSIAIAVTWFALAAPAAAQDDHSAVPDASGHTAVQRLVGQPQHDQGRADSPQLANAPQALSSTNGMTIESADETSGQTRVAATDVSGAMPLPPRSERQRRQVNASSASSSGRALLTVVTSLVIVLVVFFAFVWVTRSAAPKGMAPLSKEVVESLGRAPLLGRQQMQLIRVGNKLILLSVTPTGADTLTEITDPAEVDRLAGLCRQGQSGSISDSFRQVLAQASAEPATASRSQPRQARVTGGREPYRA